MIGIIKNHIKLFIFSSFCITFSVLAVDYVSDGSPMTASFFNSIINTINGFEYDSTNKILNVNGGVKHSISVINCDLNNKGSVKFSGDAFYGCNSLGWQKLGN